jgi:hypothetical protein
MMMMLISFFTSSGIRNNYYFTYLCVFELQLKEEKKGERISEGWTLLLSSLTSQISQRLCLPSSLSSDEFVVNDVNDEVEAALVISLAISSAALALFEASLVMSLTLSLV